MYAYLSKTEDECSHEMNEAFNEGMTSSLTINNQMKSITRAYSIKRNCHIPEAVYQIMPELWLQNTFLSVVFTDTNTQ